MDEQRRFWIVYQEADEDACDIREDLGQGGMEVKIAFPMFHNDLRIDAARHRKVILESRAQPPHNPQLD